MVSTRHLALVIAAIVAVSLQEANGEQPRLAKPGSTHPSFPLDAFARPAYKVTFRDDDPVNNQTAIRILRGSSEGRAATRSRKSEAASGNSLNELREYRDRRGADEDESKRFSSSSSNNSEEPFKAYLYRPSPESLYVCTMNQQSSQTRSFLRLDEQGMRDYRADILKRALDLIEPLKKQCLYYTMNWFTYSLCHGKAVKQFHAVPGTLGGGKAPTVDTSQDSYVVGRWKPELESIRDFSSSAATFSSSPSLGDGEPEPVDSEHSLLHRDTGRDSVDSDVRHFSQPAEGGTELMELVHFSSIDDRNLSGNDERDSLSADGIPAGLKEGTSIEGKGRYISQLWADGTLCDINNEPRTAEVQFHCAKSPAVDRIALIKEVTTCNYVVVVETPRLCSVPALAQAEEDVNEVVCRPILSDERLHQRYLDEVQETHANLLEGAKAAKQNGATKKESSGSSRDFVRDPQVTYGTDTEDAFDLDASLGDDALGTSSTSPLGTQLSDLILERIAAARKLPLNANGGVIENIEVVVGMDEAGNLILEPKSDRSSDQEGEEDDLFYDALPSEEQAQAGGSSDDKKRKGQLDINADNWVDFLRQIKEMGLVGADGAVYQVLEEGQAQKRQQQQQQQQGNSATGEAGAAQPLRQAQAPADQRPGQAAAAGSGHGTRPGAGAGAAGQGDVPRGAKMMVRETETFAQRVDRIYRAREAEQKKEQQPKGGKPDDRDGQKHKPQHDEL